MIRRPPRSTLTDTLFPLHDALPIFRVTTGDTRPGRQTWVYGRRGKPCRRCGTRIREDTLGPDQLTERNIFFCPACQPRSEEHTSELQSLMRISYAVFCLKKKKKTDNSPVSNAHTKPTKTNKK